MRYLRVLFIAGSRLECYPLDPLIRHKNSEGVSHRTLKLELAVVTRASLPFHVLLKTRRKYRLVPRQMLNRRPLKAFWQVFQYTPQIRDVAPVSLCAVRPCVKVPLDGDPAVTRRDTRMPPYTSGVDYAHRRDTSAIRVHPPPQGGRKNHETIQRVS